MNYLTINFLGETHKVKFPNSLKDLHQKIMEIFILSDKDVEELLISYNKNYILENDEDFQSFINEKVFQIDIDINQRSELYRKNLLLVRKENEEMKIKYDEMISQANNIDKEKNEKKEKVKIEIDQINKKIKELEEQKKEIDKEIQSHTNKIKKIKNMCQKEIKQLEKKQKKLYLNADTIGKKIGLQPKIKQKEQISKNKKEKKIQNKIKDKIKEEQKDEIIFQNQLKEKTEEEKQEKKEKQEINIINQTKIIKKEDEEKEEIHDKYECDGCGMNPIMGKRYRCQTCENFDYCQNCYSSKNHEHKLLYASAKKNDEKKIIQTIHHNYRCNECNNNIPIKGIRYKCTMCPDFDFCENCEKIKGKKHGHPLIRLPYENMLNNVYMKGIDVKNKNNLKVICDNCSKNIKENIYKCCKCSNYILCEKCIEKKQSEHFHPFIKYY